jgi:NAD(P)-dependent dehydrogenase (short-subunit alcohol dehydrogenase family)
VASAGGLAGVQHFGPAYQATKAAVINLTRNLALSWADRGVRVNALAPGWFPSEMTTPFIEAPVYGDHILRHEPTGRVGDPAELVAPLLFLASDASRRITGHTLVVDGGISAGFMGARYDRELYDFHAAAVPDGLGERILPRRPATAGVTAPSPP